MKKTNLVFITIITLILSLLTYSSSYGFWTFKQKEIKEPEHLYKETKINKYNVKYTKTYNGSDSDYEVIVGIAKEDGEYLGDMIKRYPNAISGINGAYFSPKAYGNKTNHTWANRIHKGEKYEITPDMGIRDMMGFDSLGNTIIHGISGTGNTKEIQEGLSNFPVLLNNGKDTTQLWKSHITPEMKEKKDKTFFCSDNEKNVYFGIVEKISMNDLSGVLKKLGCINAMNLDAGASTELIYNLDKKTTAWSPVMDGIIVVKKSDLTKKEKEKKEKLGSSYTQNQKYEFYQKVQKIKSKIE